MLLFINLLNLLSTMKKRLTVLAMSMLCAVWALSQRPNSQSAQDGGSSPNHLSSFSEAMNNPPIDAAWKPRRENRGKLQESP